MGRHRTVNKFLPRNLYCNKGYYSYRHPIEKRYYGLGTNRMQAVRHANRCNRELLLNSVAIRMAEGLVTLLSKQEIVKAAMSRRNVAGVYFLVRGTEIVYVGQSLNAHGRISQHIREAKKDFDGYHIIQCDPAMLTEVEATYIAELQPIYNQQIPQDALRRRIDLIQSLENIG